MKKFYDKLIQTRHYLHRHPELSGQEYQTTDFLKKYLEDLEIRILDSNLKTGLIAEIGSGQPIIALRADIDALPIFEQTNLPYASQNPGVMHACGHDFHQTSLLGAAELLKAMEEDLQGTIRLIFQPAEETSCGALEVIETGYLDDVKAIVGFHNMPQLKANQLALKPGAMMAGVEKFKVEVEGISSHAARPDLGVDTVITLTSMVQALQVLVARTVSPFEANVLSITHIEAGTTWNVLPQNGFFEGTIRSFSPNSQKKLKEDFIKIVENTAENFGARVSITWDQTPPVTYNDPDLTELLFENSKTFAEVVEARPSTAGEDFAFYQEKIPGVFAFIGSNGADAAPDLHHDTMTIDDEAFKVSVPYYVESALCLLRCYK
ncbi:MULTISPECIES: amidohydrolase [Streptococcus]|uniref:Amidohydrolase n=1 Tax=Streptococcus gordonii TaxID=1302 RepID=A0AB35FR02_STRGN|nr:MULTISPECIES: amidohydrolase [Streptococcus]ARC46210.1 amidohydrolase [Streptococcus gordonii]MBW7663554.1 amidohydrolase [Streptococcus gordonii]MBZ2126862.1 amidohydrolase [Streptococcus gordonii]MBZ2128876.1 amidohydrolase [Streptococcus gordonii]MBZ2139104.1 amidohydrolase [Streptococcus gordonii]